MKSEPSDLDQEIFSQVEYNRTPIISPVYFAEEAIGVRSFSFDFRASLGPKPAGHLSHKSLEVPRSDQPLLILIVPSLSSSIDRCSS